MAVSIDTTIEKETHTKKNERKTAHTPKIKARESLA